jgi:multidrug efflux pump subunit AcrB
MIDNIGMPVSGINLTYNNTGVIGPQDGDIQIKLKEDHKPTAIYVQALREQLPRQFPGVSFAFLPADIVSQILNFGAPAPIDLQIRGNNLPSNFAYANKLLSQIRRIPGIADARIQQSPNNPGFNIDVDRTRAQYVGLTERDVTNSLVVNLAGSSQVAPTYYLNPDNGISYSIVMQTPQYKMDSLGALETLPITAVNAGTSPPILGGVPPPTRWCRNMTSSRWCRSMPRRRAAISAPWRPTCERSSTTPKATCRRALRWCCSARCRP